MLAIAQQGPHHLHDTSLNMSEAIGPLNPGQRLSLTGSAVPANLDNSGSSGQQLVRVSKTNQAGYDVIPLDVAKVTGNPDLDKFLPGTSRAPLGDVRAT